VVKNINWNGAVFYTELTATKAPTRGGWFVPAKNRANDPWI
jgi:hypothetical protein